MSSTVLWRDPSGNVTAEWNKDRPYSVTTKSRVDPDGVAYGITKFYPSEDAAIRAAKRAAKNLAEGKDEDAELREHSRQFFNWLEKVTAENETSPVGLIFKPEGFEVAHTGGGCLAWEKQLGGKHFLWITAGDADLGDTTSEPFLVGLYNSDGEELAYWDAKDADDAVRIAREQSAKYPVVDDKP